MKKKNQYLPTNELADLITESINKEQILCSKIPKFPTEYFIVQDIEEEREILKLSPQRTLSRISTTSLKADIYRYCKDEIPEIAGPVSAQTVDNIAKLWTYSAKPIEQPAYILDKDDDGYCFARLPFNSKIELFPDNSPVNPANDFPECFQSILDRCSQPLALCAFIGSIFYEKSHNQQYLYLKGDGGDSKGTLLNFLMRLLKQTVVSTEPPKKEGAEDRFWSSRFYGKRLAIMPDCNNVGFFSTGKFKSLTGGDPIMIERKFRNGFTTNLDCKFIVASNHDPLIDGQEANIRRIIYCKFETVPEHERDPNFVDVLIKYADEIIRGCKYIYLEQCGEGHNPIPCDPPRDVIDDNEDIYTDIFEKKFRVEPGAWVAASDVKQWLDAHKISSPVQISKIKAVWNRRYGVVNDVVKYNGKAVRVYKGMAVRHFTSVDNYSSENKVVHLDPKR